jgi:cytochrome b561
MTKDHLRFTPLQRGLHWAMALAILAMLFIGVGMMSTIDRNYLVLVNIHKPLGIAILALAVWRLLLRWRRGAPPLPAAMPEAMKLAARLSHLAFYALMFAMPLLGWAMLSAADFPVVVAGVRLPSIVPPSAELHSVLAFCFFALILLHLAAALFHAWVRRDGVFEAMAPRRPQR